MSNNVAKHPKIYLILILVLILIIIIILIYYRGLLFIGPFSPNNINTKVSRKNMQGGGIISSDNNKIIKSLKY